VLLVHLDIIQLQAQLLAKLVKIPIVVFAVELEIANAHLA
jgi:hypothetical protein